MEIHEKPGNKMKSGGYVIMAKELKYGAEARAALEAGVNKLAGMD